MTDTEALKKLVMQSTSLGPDEKKTLDLMIPYMKEEDLEKLFKAFSVEQGVLAAVPEMTSALESKLIETFDLSAGMAKNYREWEIKKMENAMRDKENSNMEEMINRI